MLFFYILAAVVRYGVCLWSWWGMITCPAVERTENTGSNPFTAHGPGNFVPQTLQFKSLWWNNLLNFYGTESFVACMVETKISQYTLACIFPFLSVFVIVVHSFGSVVWFSFPWPWLQCVHLNNSICNAQPHYHILPPLPSLLSHWCFNSRGQILYSVPLLELKKKQRFVKGTGLWFNDDYPHVFPLACINQCKLSTSYFCPCYSMKDYQLLLSTCHHLSVKWPYFTRL